MPARCPLLRQLPQHVLQNPAVLVILHLLWRIDADDGEAGFEGSGPEAMFPDGQFLGWTPGQRPHLSDDNVWTLPSGADLVIELHLVSTGKPERIQPKIGLVFTNQPPKRTPYMLRLSNQRLDIPAGESRYVSTDSYQLPVDAEVLAVQPHAHNLARTVTGTARLPDGRGTPPCGPATAW